MKIYNYLFIGLFLMFFLDTSGQNYKKAYTIPDRPTILDTILIVDSASTPSTNFVRFANNITISDSNITLTNCYSNPSGFDIVFYIKDTSLLGVLHAGRYYCKFYSRKDGRASTSDPYSTCDTLSNLDTFYYSFVVSDFHTAIEDLSLTTLTLSPNPATTTLYSSTSLHDIDLTITDITGRICAAPHTDRDIDISALPAGVYCLRLQTREGSSVVRRFVRE